jgi:hypothetical protein
MSPKDTRKIECWEAFFSKCMQDHVDFNVFPKELSKQTAQVPLGGQDIFEAWARQRKGGIRVSDRLLCYLELLLIGGVVTETDILQSLCASLEVSLVAQGWYPTPTGTWKQTIEAAVLQRMAFQLANRKRSAIGGSDERISNIRVAKPLVVLLSTFTKALEGTESLIGPPLDIGTTLGQYIIAYLNNLLKGDILTSNNGGPPKGSEVFILRKSGGQAHME